uniref:Lipase maturation factor n=1 Tax=Ornithodoros turicata TaxID=34597 RepID=A0A2R5LLL9_9ACAR
MGEIRLTRDLFLWAMSIIYLSAFASLYHQIPGLYGDRGILPIRAILPVDTSKGASHQQITKLPTLLWLAPNFGLKVSTMMEFIALLGTVLSFVASVWSRFRDCFSFLLLWVLYFSLYQVGQTFMWFQWDILLLEAGFLCVLVAPVGILHRTLGLSSQWSLPHHPHDRVTVWLVRWLLFRLMFASGVVKLTSKCPTWWGLTALDIHFESECIPTPAAWFFHHLPSWLLRLGVVLTYVVEIFVPFLFFVPLRSVKNLSFYSQVIFQALILLTGNYNFFNLLTIVLCLSLIDDDFFTNGFRRNLGHKSFLQTTGSIMGSTASLVIFFGLFQLSVKLFNVRLLSDWSISTRIAFTPAQFQRYLSETMPFTIWIGIASLGVNILVSLYRSLFFERGIFRRLVCTVGTLLCGAVAIWMFCVSLVPFSNLDHSMQGRLWPVIRQWHSKVEPFSITSSYGLFRRMTGIDGRPEVILEGSESSTGPWKEYHFLYKPGNVSCAPPINIPHQPRLDWQLWFAALGRLEHNPWFVGLVHRLLTNQDEVLNLIDRERSPFPQSPPKYMRAQLYTYHYTPYDPKRRMPNVGDWWTRSNPTEYMPPLQKDHPSLTQFLQQASIPTDSPGFKSTNPYLKPVLAKAREVAKSMAPTTFVWSWLATAISIKYIARMLRI